MITTLKTITDLDLHNVTGGNLSLGERKESGGGIGSKLSGAWEGAKNHWQGVKNTVGDSLHGSARQFFGPASKIFGL